MLQKISRLIKSLEGLGYHRNSSIIIALSSLSRPDTDKILAALKNKFSLDESKEAKIKRYLSIKNLSLPDSEDEALKNEAASAAKTAEVFLQNNTGIKQELEEANKLWNTWESWTSSGRTSEYSSDSSPMTPEENDFVNEEDPTGVHANVSGAKPGLAFSIPGIPLTSDKQPKNFYYLSPFNDKGELMDVDSFFSHYIKMGVVPIHVNQSGSIFYEQFLNTAEDIFDMDETWVNEYIGLMKMEDSVYRNWAWQNTRKSDSRFFAGETNPYDDDSGMNVNEMSPDQEAEYWGDQEERNERKRLQVEQEKLRSLVGENKKNLLGAREQARISGKPEEELTTTQTATPDVAKQMEDLRKIISCAFGIAPEEWYKELKTNLREDKDAYRLLESDLSGFYSLFQNDKKGWEEIAKFIAEKSKDAFNNNLFIRMRLYRIYKPEEYKFSEKTLENLIERPNGLDVFYKANLWKELPPHFIELVAEKDPYKFFNSEIFKSGGASDRAIGIASATLINRYVDSNLANYWLSLGISSKVPRSHFDSIVKLLAEQDPARFLAWTSKDGKKLSDSYPEERATAEENFLDLARQLPHEDPITFFSPVFPSGKKLWADYYATKSDAEQRVNSPHSRTMEEGISIAIATTKQLLNTEEEKKMSFSANWMKAGLYRFTKLDEATELVVDNLISGLQSFEKKYGYNTSLRGVREDAESLNDLKEYLNKAINNSSKVEFYNYNDQANFPAILTGIKEYLDK